MGASVPPRAVVVAHLVARYLDEAAVVMAKGTLLAMPRIAMGEALEHCCPGGAAKTGHRAHRP